MESADETEREANAEMHTRRIDMGDGRYLIFFTFGDEDTRTDKTEPAEPKNV